MGSKIGTPDVRICPETNEVRLDYEQFQTWMADVVSTVDRIQGILGGLDAQPEMLAKGIGDEDDIEMLRFFDEQISEGFRDWVAEDHPWDNQYSGNLENYMAYRAGATKMLRLFNAEIMGDDY